MAYWKSIAAKKCPSLFVSARASLESPRLDQRSASNSRCSKTTPLGRHRPSTAIPTRRGSADSSKRSATSRGSTACSALQQAKLESELLHDAERVREQSRSSTPVAGIVKPYEHRGSVPQAASLRFSFTQQQQNLPSTTDPITDIDCAKMLALNIEVIDLRKQVVTKDREIQRLIRDQRRASGAYLPRARSASILANTAVDEAAEKSAPEAQSAFPIQRPSTSAAPRRLPLSSLSGSSSSSSRPETVGGAVSGAGSNTATATIIPGWTDAFTRENEITSVDSSAQVTSPNSATGAGEQQSRGERKLSATELLAERRASYIHAAAEQVIERNSRRSQSNAPGERRGSRVGGGEGGERRLTAAALLSERRASVSAAAAEIPPDLTLAATAAELSPRRSSVSSLVTPRRGNTLSAAEQGLRRGSSTISGTPAVASHATRRRGSKFVAEAAAAEQVTRRVTITASAAISAPERLPIIVAAPAEQMPRRTSTVAGAAAPTTDQGASAIVDPPESIKVGGMSSTSSAEPGEMVPEESCPPSIGVSTGTPAVVQGENTTASVVDTAKTDISSFLADSP